MDVTMVLGKLKCKELRLKDSAGQLTDGDKLLLIDLACDVTDKKEMPGFMRQLAYDVGLVKADLCIEGQYPVATQRLINWMDVLWKVPCDE